MSEDCSLEVLQAIYLKVVEASPDAKIVIDASGSIIVFNNQAEFLFGYAREEVLGHPIEMLMPGPIAGAHASHRAKYFREPKTREMGTGQRLEAKHRDGSSFQVQIKLAPLVVQGAGVHALAVVRRVQGAEE